MSDPTDIRETVRRGGAEAATRSSRGDHDQARSLEAEACDPHPASTTDDEGRLVFGAELSPDELTEGVPQGAVEASLRRGVPTAVADLHPGETVLDLARTNAAAAGVDNAEFIHGYLEDIPLPDASVDVVISNCGSTWRGQAGRPQRGRHRPRSQVRLEPCAGSATTVSGRGRSGAGRADRGPRTTRPSDRASRR